ncbi:MAG: hypothetical protein BM555_00290 [Crocinitomix sp. MedPE-SWsnd]|nr:MAG: hypothetical protein BM555_00290 [Crocinitomix sp. MedPE-SWsnd]
MSEKKKKGFWEKFAHKELSRTHEVQEGSELFLLSEAEIAALKKIRKRTFWRAGLAGALGVILLYAPYHIFGSALFPMNHVWIPFYDDYIDIEIGFLVYSLVLVLLEIWFLTFTNIKAVAHIAKACGHPNPNDRNFENNISALISVGLEKKQKQLESIGINPYEGLNPIGVFVFQIILRLKATVSGILFKLLVKKALGRYALRAVIDFAGIPVYSFWNIWGSRKVMDESRIRVMAPPLIKRCSDLLYESQKENPEFVKSLYDSLQLISESKRSFHYNHFLLSVTLLERFGIEIKEEPPYNDDFLEEIPSLSPQTRKAVQQLFVFGIMIDGAISRREKKAIRYLIEKNVLEYSEAEIVKWSKDYFDGRGIEAFFAA